MLMAVDDINKAPVVKSKGIAIVLLVLLGQFGAHNFYLRHKRAAYTQLMMAVFAYIGVILVVVSTLMNGTQSNGGMDISNALVVILGASLTMGVTITLGLWLLVDLVLILFKKDDTLVWHNREA